MNARFLFSSSYGPCVRCLGFEVRVYYGSRITQPKVNMYTVLLDGEVNRCGRSKNPLSECHVDTPIYVL